MTENPFGCHRLQVSATNNPWWSFYRLIGNTYILNQEELKKRIDSYASIYCICPCFNYQQIMKAYNSLPVKLSQKKYAKLWADGFGLKNVTTLSALNQPYMFWRCGNEQYY